ncbi:hypothetical protein ASPZODRAFT_22423 [Penicilliopsis zonata CBS 506.65]|uniref:DNA polymerase epsilon subunit D n=1 Tax=Penicilliopsis zonata CBS 506.65 TaxID=1073090 RepID=A0A1L9SR42_9EURO|nr:hypothetical protein ASPZODRAFT_22423 [Penicilliopsis zonata CBS 506.65]OJJ49690.1 hypothetical protein ASPZODRAFT_22423 [Penicilliopsis zonata CBS 506.65]
MTTHTKMARKSTATSTPETEDPQPIVTATEQQLKARAEGGVSVEDYLLPRSLTLRLAKSVLPPNTSIQKDALLAIQKAATVFVSYLSSHANEATMKRTVAPADVLAALSELEFEAFRPRLERELDVHTDLIARRKNKKVDPSSSSSQSRKDPQVEEGSAHAAKRVKRGEGDEDDHGDETELEHDEDETEEEQEPEPEHEHEDEEDEEDEDEDTEEEEDQDQKEQNEIDRVEDLDRDSRPSPTMDPDAAGDSDSDGV